MLAMGKERKGGMYGGGGGGGGGWGVCSFIGLVGLFYRWGEARRLSIIPNCQTNQLKFHIKQIDRQASKRPTNVQRHPCSFLLLSSFPLFFSSLPLLLSSFSSSLLFFLSCFLSFSTFSFFFLLFLLLLLFFLFSSSLLYSPSSLFKLKYEA